MSPLLALVLGSCLVTEATGLRTAPDVKVVSAGAAGLTKNLMVKAAMRRCNTSSKINPGTPLPEGRFNWDIDDFDPEALKMSPCGQDGESKVFDTAGDETGEQGLTVACNKALNGMWMIKSGSEPDWGKYTYVKCGKAWGLKEDMSKFIDYEFSKIEPPTVIEATLKGGTDPNYSCEASGTLINGEFTMGCDGYKATFEPAPIGVEAPKDLK